MKMKPTPRPPTPRRVPKRMTPRRVLPARAASSNDELDDYDAESEPNMKLSHAFIVVLLLHVLAVGGVFAFNTLKPGQPSSERKAKAEAQAAQPAASVEPKVETSTATAKAAAEPKPTASIVPGATYTVVAGDTLTKIASLHKTSVESLEKANNLEAGSTIRVGQQLTIPPAGTPAAAATKPATAATTAPPARKVAEKPSTPKATETKPSVTEKPAPAAPAAAASSGSTYVVEKGDNPYSIAKKLKVSYTELLKVNNIDDPKKLQIGQKLVVP